MTRAKHTNNTKTPGVVDRAPVFDLDTVAAGIPGLLAPEAVEAEVARISRLPIEDYEQAVIQPVRQSQRFSARKIMKALVHKIVKENDDGPLYALDCYMLNEAGKRIRVGLIGQNRENRQGVWSPEHHRKAAELAVKFSRKRMPLITFIDTPGADAGETANQQDQAHSISSLITVMAQLPVPTVGIILGTAYSGGAIPLAATNVLLSVRDGLFSTIQPQGLASIARKQKLAWQQCAQRVGVSACETACKGWIDGIVDYSPSDQREGLEHLKSAVVGSLAFLEKQLSVFVQPDGAAVFAPVGSEYQRSLAVFLDKPERLAGPNNSYYADSLTQLPSLFGYTLRHMRQQQVASRLSFTTISSLPAAGSVAPIQPQQQSSEKLGVFNEWFQREEKLIYEQRLLDRYERFQKARQAKDEDRSALAALVLGKPQEKYRQAAEALAFELGLYLYNRWKAQAAEGFVALSEFLAEQAAKGRTETETGELPAKEDVTLPQLIRLPELNAWLAPVSLQLQFFDALYDGILGELELVASEANRYRSLSEESMAQLLDAALKATQNDVCWVDANAREFSTWLTQLNESDDVEWFLRQVSEWKQRQHARLSESLFVFLTYLFENLIPRYMQAQAGGEAFDGKINPTWIGRRKDFWHRLSIAYCDLQIQALQKEYKSQWPEWTGWVDELCRDFTPQHDDWVSSDPCAFPGYLESIHKQISAGKVPAGIVTGIATLKVASQPVGLFISNLAFQAGALDMASARKLLALIQHCEDKRLPIVGLVSSGGMQTKEGAGSLFAMAAVNEALTRFRQLTGLPVIMVGFGDCTGGAQASFVTHPLVETWYISGANIPFAGQIVVPSYLPSTCTLANYLSKNAKAEPETDATMTGLLSHPFADSFDRRLLQIDSQAPRPRCSLQDMLKARLNGGKLPQANAQPSDDAAALQQHEGRVAKVFAPVEKLLIHARGCTAVKLIRDAQRNGTPVVLVQSDPDMGSVPAEMLGARDELVCIGGNTPDESYLNANSVLKVASMTGADSLHPGIGFLSEDPDFAKRCQIRGLNFIGPDYRAMSVMGDKASALNAAMAADVPVVPGSHGIISDAQHARRLAEEIGFPLLLKAAFGGGGKGIAKLTSMDELAETYTRLRREAEAAFGRGALYMERFVEHMRHIEVQVLRDSHGHCSLPGIRDCSVQRNNQKLLEESGSTMLSETLKQSALTYAKRIADAVNYVGAGTVEFIYDLDHECLYFMEMNTRLQVEHPVTEAVSGIDIVAQQLRIASGASIADLAPKEEGYAIEARINAEQVMLRDGSFSCQPSPGLVLDLVMPKDSHVDVISCIDKGKAVAPYYDSLVMQIIAKGNDRAEAIERLTAFLRQTRIEGIVTNLDFVAAILEDEVFRGGKFDTGFLQGFGSRIDASSLQREPSGRAVSAKGGDISIPGTAELKVLAPASCIFYRSPTPDEKPFVTEGDVVDTQQTLCLMEAMKMYSPLKLRHLNKAGEELYADGTRYRINRVMNDDGQPVNTGDLLFVLSPLPAEKKAAQVDSKQADSKTVAESK
ncbi:MAG: carbamoyl-phosphate synthase large subunit [unclassified Hahellaceae]|nr:carbamoyl-phosphate synthase large subunit [Hahellaceae bacterium]|tara:strand:- start:114232 stop:118845 length:4614 start_codon:yes stop_codon:yes gene_type:complete